jgi:hypothetical protein
VWGNFGGGMRKSLNACLIQVTIILLLSACSDRNPAFEQAKKSVWGSLENGCDYERISFDDKYVIRYASDELKSRLVSMGIAPFSGNDAKWGISDINSDGDQSFILNVEGERSSKFVIDTSGDILREVERGKLGYRQPVEPGGKILSGEYKICGSN